MLSKNGKKLVLKKNKYFKSVHNFKHTKINKLRCCLHNVSKDIIKAYASMIPIYSNICKDFSQVDLVDLEMYERWLNG